MSGGIYRGCPRQPRLSEAAMPLPERSARSAARRQAPAMLQSQAEGSRCSIHHRKARRRCRLVSIPADCRCRCGKERRHHPFWRRPQPAQRQSLRSGRTTQSHKRPATQRRGAQKAASGKSYTRPQPRPAMARTTNASKESFRQASDRPRPSALWLMSAAVMLAVPR